MQKTVRTAVANLYTKHSFMSSQTTQALLGETVDILDTHENWYRIKQWDGYESWVHAFHLSENQLNNAEKFTFLSQNNSVCLKDSKLNIILPFGVSLPILGIDTSFVTVQFPWGEVGVAIKTELPTFPNMRDRIIHFAKTFLGVPYHWGGISSFGCDCSGFVQTVFKAAGIHLPRDSYQQREVPNGRQISLEDTKIGDLIFFAEDGKIDHVGITLGKREIIHCSGYVQIESLAEDSETFNNKLFNRLESCISINELMD